MLETNAFLLHAPQSLSLEGIALDAPGDEDVVVESRYSGISTGTEKLLWTGRMPDFPGMGYPLVPGYETVGEVVEAGCNSGRRAGDMVFVPGATCYGPVRGLFGGSASRIVTGGARVVPVGSGPEDALTALAATAHHALAGGALPGLIVGHGALGRLMARLVIALGGPAPTVWEIAASRREGDFDYPVVAPEDDPRRDYAVICDVSGAVDVLPDLVTRLAPGGELVLAGFYSRPLSFDFPPLFLREARLRVAAQWKPADIAAVRRLVEAGEVSLAGLISDLRPARDAGDAYRDAFSDAAPLKTVIDWRTGA